MSLFAIQNMSITLLEIPTGCLSDKWDRKRVCCVGARFMLVSFILDAIKYLLKHKRLRIISLAETWHYGLNEAAFDFNSVFFKQFVPEWSLGIFRSIGHFANSVGNYFSFLSAKRWSLKFTILFGAFCDNLNNIISVLAASVWSPIIKIVSTFCSGLKEPAQDTLIQNDCSAQERATILSIISLIGSLFYSLCAILIGILADITSPYTAMLCFDVLALTSNCLFFCCL